MRPIQIFGSGIAGKSYTVTRQRRVNVYLEKRPDGDKTKIAVYGTPGCKLAFTISVGQNAPSRGIIAAVQGLFSVNGNTLTQVNTAGVVIASKTLNSAAGNVSMSYNPTQIMVVDGTNGYIFTPSTATLTQITSAGFPNGARTCTFASGYFIAEMPGTGQFFVSNLFDGTTWNALAFATASQYPDILYAVDSITSNLILFGGIHTEFWQNVGATPEPFAPILSATAEYGLLAVWSRAHVDNSIIFLGTTPQGGIQICRLKGYDIKPISTPDLENIFATFSTVTDAEAFTYVIDKHPMYQITFPSANRSFLYDISSDLWSEVQTGIPTGYAQRHIGRFSAAYNGKAYVTDYQNGNVYNLDPATYTDNGQTIVREIVTRHALEGFNVFTIDEIYLDMETGVGLQQGQGVNPLIMVECSKDGGRTFSTPRTIGLGAVGQYKALVVARRFGSARDFVFRFRMTDPVKFVITEGAMSVRTRQQ